MELQGFFFEPNQPDRFKDLDKPTEAIFRTLFGGLPFLANTGDRAILTRAGVSKTATDANVNSRTNNDEPGASPIGFTTFVRPSQIPMLIGGNGCTVSFVPRMLGAPTNTDTGLGVQDWRIDISPQPAPTSNDIVTIAPKNIDYVVGTAPNYSVQTTNVPTATGLETMINTLITNHNILAAKLSALAFTQQINRLDVGDIVQTTVEPSSWYANVWLEAAGGVVQQLDYPELYLIYGSTYNTGGEPVGTFRLPDYRDKVLRGKQAVGGVANGGGGADSQSVVLVAAQIPIHNHAFSATTSFSGDHFHGIGTTEGAETDGTPAKGKLGGAAGTASTTPAGNHQHTISGTTADAGNSSPVVIPTLPRYANIYYKIKAKSA